MAQIPVQHVQDHSPGVPRAVASDPIERLLERFKELAPSCRELMRRRIFGLNKRLPGCAGTGLQSFSPLHV